MTGRSGGSPDLAVVVSPNGLGHARRALGVLHRLLGRLPELRVALIADGRALRRFDDWSDGRHVLDRVTLIDGVVAPGPTWSHDAALYDDGRLMTWERNLAEVGAVRDARLVVSDNLVGTLAVRPDAVLMGSFLMSDVLDGAHRGHGAVDAFVAHERALLERHRPPMLCVGAMAMPGVLARTDAVPLPWMCEAVRAAGHDDDPNAGLVGVLGGRTGAADDLLAKVAAALIDHGIQVTTPLGLPGALSFDHSPTAFQRCAVVVARPGLGTVHDCVGAEAPMVLVHEPDNQELLHNAKRLEGLGFGWDAGAHASPSRVVELVSAALVPSRRAAAVTAMAAVPRDGLVAAAAWLHERIERT